MISVLNWQQKVADGHLVVKPLSVHVLFLEVVANYCDLKMYCVSMTKLHSKEVKCKVKNKLSISFIIIESIV